MDSTLTLALNGSHSLYLDGVAWFATQTFTWLPLFCALLYILFREHDLKHFVYLIVALFLCILICDQTASSLFKPLVERYRPSQNPYIMHCIDLVHGYRGGIYGFFSSHAANTAALTTFCSLLLRHRYVTYSLTAWTLLNCWTRLYLGVHYVGDILTGLLFGCFVGCAIYLLYIFVTPGQRKRSYAPAILHLLPLAFLFSLCLIAIPWQHYF